MTNEMIIKILLNDGFSKAAALDGVKEKRAMIFESAEEVTEVFPELTVEDIENGRTEIIPTTYEGKKYFINYMR